MEVHGKATLPDFEFNGSSFFLPAPSLLPLVFLYGTLSMFPNLCECLCHSMTICSSMSPSHVSMSLYLSPPCFCLSCSWSVPTSWFFPSPCLSLHPPLMPLSLCLQLLAGLSLHISPSVLLASYLFVPPHHPCLPTFCLPLSGAGGPATDAGEARAGGLSAQEAG